MPPNIHNDLLDGKSLTGVLSLDKQPPVRYIEHGLLDIESCIDDPSVLGQHIKKNKKPIKREDVYIEKKFRLNQNGVIMLRRRGLTCKELFKLLPLRTTDSITELDISRNNLTMLPKEMFTYLNQLQTFNAASNQLKEISTEFYNLKQLKVLNLSQNQITHIPAELPKKTPNLVTLRISGNQISQLPPTIRYWTHLKHLHLGSVYGGNQLKELPPTITRMQTLEDLDLSNNQLRLLPDNFFLFSLISLNLSHNQLDYIPKSIARCTRLKSLNLSKNHLTCLPSDLMNLHQLELFDISENLLCIMPAEILERLSSTALLITGNPLTRPGHCDLQQTSQDPYTKILSQMTQRALPRSPVQSPGTPRRRLVNPLCEVPSSSTLSLESLQQDDDATIDHELSFHARQLNISKPHYTSQDISPILLDTPGALPSETQLLPSLRELAARTIISEAVAIPFDLLPDHLAQDLRFTKSCSHCSRPFVNEWVTSVQVKSFAGHPAVVRRVRFCSLKCWKLCMPPETKSVICVHK